MADRDWRYLPFTKMQAVGNDFVVLEASRWPAGTDWSRQAIRLCDRRFGVGSDGLMLWDRSDKADLRARMWNPDGTADMCGNGTRCVLHLARTSGVLPPTGTIETLSGVRAYRFNDDGSITVGMGTPKFALEEIPVNRESRPIRHRKSATNLGLFVSRRGGSIIVDAINTGSTHAVIWSNKNQISDDEFFCWSPLIETDLRTFPERTSVMWAVVEDEQTLHLRIWERGVGETLGCGTGACAAAVLARVRGKVSDGEVAVHSKGGTLRVGWAGGEGDPMYLTGTAHVTYQGMVHGED